MCPAHAKRIRSWPLADLQKVSYVRRFGVLPIPEAGHAELFLELDVRQILVRLHCNDTAPLTEVTRTQ